MQGSSDLEVSINVNRLSAAGGWTLFAIALAMCVFVLFRRDGAVMNERAAGFTPAEQDGPVNIGAGAGNVADAPPPHVRGAYCGLYCVYAACHLLGNTGVQFDELLQPKYIGSPSGSSAEEIVRCAKDHGLHAYAASSLTLASIRAANVPAVLHAGDL